MTLVASLFSSSQRGDSLGRGIFPNAGTRSDLRLAFALERGQDPLYFQSVLGRHPDLHLHKRYVGSL